MTPETNLQQRRNSNLVDKYSGPKDQDEDLPEDNICKECRRWLCNCEDR